MSDSSPNVAASDDILTISDPVEAALVDALKVATAAVDLDAIKLLAVELRERRLARVGIVDLAARRERRP